MKPYTLFFIFALLLVAAVSSADDGRYMSRFEAAEMIVGEWEHYGVMDLEHGYRYEFPSPYTVHFMKDGVYEVNAAGRILIGSWHIVEIGYRPWIRMKLDEELMYRTFRLIFSEGHVKFHDPSPLPEARGFDTDLLRSP